MKVKKVSELFTNQNLKNEEKFVDIIEKLNKDYYEVNLFARVEYENGYYSKGKVEYKKKKDHIYFSYGYMMYEDHGDYHEFEIHENEATLNQRMEFCIEKGIKKVNLSDVCIVYKFGDHIDAVQEIYEYDDTIKSIIKEIIDTVNELRKYKIKE